MPEVAIFPQIAHPTPLHWLEQRMPQLVCRLDGACMRSARMSQGGHGPRDGHVANGDMITLTLIQGVVNTFVMFFARNYVTSLTVRCSRRGSGHGIGLLYATIFAEWL